MDKLYEYIILHVFAWSPMYKLNLWCMSVPPLGSHTHTPQVQFTHMTPRKDIQNTLWWGLLKLHLHTSSCCPGTEIANI